MAINTVLNEGELTIQIDGFFDFNAQKAFLAAFSHCGDEVYSYVLDMNKAIKLDSSGLGLMLLLRTHSKDNNAKLRIVNCSHEVKRVLSIASFEKLMIIE